MVADSLIAEIRSLYMAYADAFHARSGTQVADFFYTPCMSMRGDASIHSFQSPAETAKFFQGVTDTYYEEGLRRSEFQNLEVVRIGGAPCSRQWTGSSIGETGLCSGNGASRTTWCA